MAATRTNGTRRNPTQADIIHTMLVQAESLAQERLQNAIRLPSGDGTSLNDREHRQGLVDRYSVERDTTRVLKERVRRYLDGDLSALYG